MDIKSIINNILEDDKPDTHDDSKLRRFLLDRTEDVHMNSGTGLVCEGVQFTDGSIAMRWLSDTPSTSIYSSIDDVESLHGHEGKTKIKFLD